MKNTTNEHKQRSKQKHTNTKTNRKQKHEKPKTHKQNTVPMLEAKNMHTPHARLTVLITSFLSGMLQSGHES